jgi:hypothetical protein
MSRSKPRNENILDTINYELVSDLFPKGNINKLLSYENEVRFFLVFYSL